MAVIKGENLRLFIDQHCVAAATSCQVHCALQISESDTKDDVDGFIVQEPQGNSWDAQVDAMVLEGDNSQGTLVEQGEGEASSSLGGGNYYYNYKIHLRRDEMLRILIKEVTNAIITIYSESFQTIAQTPSPIRFLDYESRQEQDVYIGVATDGLTLKYAVLEFAKGLGSFVNYLKNGSIVDVEFNQTYAGQNQNRDRREEILVGQAIVQDISINAATGNVVTYSCKLIGTGALAFADTE